MLPIHLECHKYLELRCAEIYQFRRFTSLADLPVSQCIDTLNVEWYIGRHQGWISHDLSRSLQALKDRASGSKEFWAETLKTMKWSW